MYATKSKIYSVISLGVISLLLASCASAGSVSSSPVIETSMAEGPTSEVNGNDSAVTSDSETKTAESPAASDGGDEAAVNSDQQTQDQQSTSTTKENSGSGMFADTETETEQSPATTQGSNQNAGAYIPFETYNSSKDKYANTNVVLFFNAAWCSKCKKARDNFEASRKQIPEDLTIVMVDFDTSIELRKRYGVTVQHTLIQIDRAGEVLAKWSGSVTVAEIVKQLS